MKKRPILLRSIYGLTEESSRKIIGLVGTHPGAGVTHMGLLLSNYLGNVLGRKTAFLEVNTHGDFEKIEEVYFGKEGTRDKMFRLNRVVCYKHVTQSDMTDILNEEYEYLILDFGTELEKNRNEFLRCDKKLIISSLADWKRAALYQFLYRSKELKGNDSWIYLFVFGQKRELLELKREIKLKARLVGYEPEPSAVTKETIGLIHSVI